MYGEVLVIPVSIRNNVLEKQSENNDFIASCICKHILLFCVFFFLDLFWRKELRFSFVSLRIL